MDGSTASSTTAPSDRTLGEALDEAPLSLFHLKAAFTAAMGFFTDAYDLFIIGVALVLIKGEWHLSAVQTSFLGSATLLATLVGALVFGRVADILGRTRVYGLVAGIMAFGALATALAPSYIWLVACRFVLGIGIGGDYPVSAVMASEYANRERPGLLVSLVFSSQAAGLIIGPVVALALLASGVNHELAWRLMLGSRGPPGAQRPLPADQDPGVAALRRPGPGSRDRGPGRDGEVHPGRGEGGREGRRVGAHQPAHLPHQPRNRCSSSWARRAPGSSSTTSTTGTPSPPRSSCAGWRPGPTCSSRPRGR